MIDVTGQLIQVTLRNVPHSDALDGHIRDQVDRLETCYPEITDCQLVVEMRRKHRHEGNLFNVRLEIKVPGDFILLARDLREDVHVTLRNVFDAARRKLEEYRRRQRGAV